MPLNTTVVDIDELAVTLGRSADYIRRNWLKMHRDHGMPRKNPCGWIWPRAAMEAWLAGAAQQDLPREEPAPAVKPAPSGIGAIVANQNARLRERYAGGRA